MEVHSPSIRQAIIYIVTLLTYQANESPQEYPESAGEGWWAGIAQQGRSHLN